MNKESGFKRGYDKFSRREKEVFALLAKGLTQVQMGAELGVSSKTVGTYKTRMGTKLAADEIDGESIKKHLESAMVLGVEEGIIMNTLPIGPIELISSDEDAVCELLMCGFSNLEISNELNITKNKAYELTSGIQAKLLIPESTRYGLLARLTEARLLGSYKVTE